MVNVNSAASLLRCNARIARSTKVNAPDEARDIEAYLCYSDDVDK
ncbi:hypothetical protein [Nocardia sp. NPDC057668]